MLLHPYVVASGASVDLPIITEQLAEDSDDEPPPEPQEPAPEATTPDEQPGPSHAPDPEPMATLHQSFIADTGGNEDVIPRSHSSHSFLEPRPVEAESDEEEPPRRRGCDTNIQQNDRYPEAGELDNLDNEIVGALALDTGNLPDLTEEQVGACQERCDHWTRKSLCLRTSFYNISLIDDSLVDVNYRYSN